MLRNIKANPGLLDNEAAMTYGAARRIVQTIGLRGFRSHQANKQLNRTLKHCLMIKTRRARSLYDQISTRYQVTILVL